MIKGLIEDSGIEEDIPLPNIKSSTAHKIIEFCNHLLTHEPPKIEKPLKANQLSEIVTPFYSEFIDNFKD